MSRKEGGGINGHNDGNDREGDKPNYTQEGVLLLWAPIPIGVMKKIKNAFIIHFPGKKRLKI